LVRRLIALSAACSALFGRHAAAEEGQWILGAGVFLGYAFGSHPGFAIGAELFGTFVFNHEITCGPPRARYGVGPTLQVASIGFENYTLTLAGHGGSELEHDFASVRGELGATRRFGTAPGTGIHTGAAVSALVFDVAWRSAWLIDQHAPLLGVRIPPAYGLPQEGRCIIGRPLRTDSELVDIEPYGCRLVESSPAPAHACVEPAGQKWERDARYECASIPAFLQLAAELLAHDAPLALVERTLDAACDEMAHAVLCAHVASRYLGKRLWPVVPEIEARRPLAGTPGLTRLGVESWLDGCLGEGAAAARASCATARAADPVARAVSHVIAADEHRHAELGWSILAWAIHRGGDLVRDNVRCVRDFGASQEPDDEIDLEPYGCLRAREMRDIGEAHAAGCRRRLHDLM
jgi:hypothetical protein